MDLGYGRRRAPVVQLAGGRAVPHGDGQLDHGQREAAGAPQTIKLRVKRRGGSMLLILLDNPCATPIPFDGDTPLSSKQEGTGIGAASVREIAARYGGTVQFEQKAGVFYASVLLKLVPDGTGAR